MKHGATDSGLKKKKGDMMKRKTALFWFGMVAAFLTGASTQWSASESWKGWVTFACAAVWALSEAMKRW